MAAFYIVSGKTREKIEKVMSDRKAAHEAALKFAEEFGAKSYVHTNGLVDSVCGIEFTKSKEPPEDDKIWRKKYNQRTKKREDWYSPLRSTKEGREIYDRMARLRLPGQMDVGEIIGLHFLEARPGIRMYDNHAPVVAVPDDFKPKGKVKKDLTRIADIEVEMLDSKQQGKKQ